MTISVRPSNDLAPLDRCGWLAEQPPALQAWVAANGRWRVFEAGQHLYDAGDDVCEDADALFGLAAGALDFTLPLTGDEPVSVHRSEVGAWFGDLALLAENHRLVTVYARRRSRVYAVAGRDIRALLAEQPTYWPRFYALTYRNMRVALNLLGEALSLSPGQRIARRLIQLAEADGTVHATQEDLAALIGVTRATVRRTLKRLCAAGVIATGYGALRVVDPCRLERWAEPPL